MHDWYKAFAPDTWSNWAVEAIGLGATLVAPRTLGRIRRQAELMQRQNVILSKSLRIADESTKAAQRSIEVTVIKERAKLRIEIGALELKKYQKNQWTDSTVMKVYNVGA